MYSHSLVFTSAASKQGHDKVVGVRFPTGPENGMGIRENDKLGKKSSQLITVAVLKGPGLVADLSLETVTILMQGSIKFIF